MFTAYTYMHLSVLIYTRRVRPPNGGRLHEPPSPVSTARPMWLTSGRISHEVVYAGGAGAGLRLPLHAGIYQRRSRRIG